jgi:hypothetical protein
MCFEKIGSSLFEKVMKEFREQQDQAKQKVEVKNNPVPLSSRFR